VTKKGLASQANASRINSVGEIVVRRWNCAMYDIARGQM
jgi:hypothetical protein